MTVLIFGIVLFMKMGIAAGPETPIEKTQFTRLTSYEDMIAYLEDLDAASDHLQLADIGESVEGRMIPALFFSRSDRFKRKNTGKPLVFIMCQQHGDEPSGKEAALIVARKLIDEDNAILENLDVIIVPQVNPDGSEKGERKNANGMDLNRNHVILSEPESFAVHAVFLDWMPEVTLDVHEYNAIKKDWIAAGYIKDADEMLGGVTNLNINPELITFTRGTFIPECGRKIEQDGFRFHRYIVGDPFDEGRIRFSTTSINDGRQSMGIYNTLSFIIEGKRYGDINTEIARRVKGQISAMESFLNTCSAHAGKIVRLVADARSPAQPVNDRSYIRMDYYPDPAVPKLAFPVFDLYEWKHTTREFECFEPLVNVKQSVRLPYAYAFPAGETDLTDLLQKHRIPLFRLTSDQDLTTETYIIKHITPITEEDKPSEMIDAAVQVDLKRLDAGSIIVKLDNNAVHLIPLLLEPQSSWGIVTERGGRKYRFGEYIREGAAYPIVRIMQQPVLPLEMISPDN